MLALLIAALLLLLAGAVFAEGNPPGGDPPAPPATPPGGEPPKVYDEAYVKQLREEAAKHRTEKAEIAAKLAAYEKEKLSDLEKAQARAEAAEKERDTFKQEVLKAAASRAMVRLAPDILDPDLLILKIDLSAVSDSSGSLDEKKLSESLTTLRKEFPKQFAAGKTGTDAGARGQTGSGFDMNAAIRKMAGRA